MSNRSSRTWVGGPKGHLPLAEARRWALDRLEAAEAQKEALLVTLKEKVAAKNEAEKEHAAALHAVKEINAKLDQCREDLAYRMGPTDG